jgi:vacuolar-type H+-ATPase subunit I/STV1
MGQIVGALALFAVVVGFIGGWIANIVWLIGQELVFNMEQVLSIVGIVVVPLGALMGYLH